MIRAPRAVAALFLLVVAALAAGAAEERRLTGEYDSGFQDSERPLEAVFTPTGDRRWEVDFHFRHGGQELTYSGTAQGDLGDGPLSGMVRDTRRGRTFTFRGRFEDGVFTGTHAEVQRGRERKTGNLRLEAPAG